jgi:hypothetical protein
MLQAQSGYSLTVRAVSPLVSRFYSEPGLTLGAVVQKMPLDFKVDTGLGMRWLELC